MVSRLDLQSRLPRTPVSAGILADSLGCSKDTLETLLVELEGEGLVVREGGRWVRRARR